MTDIELKTSGGALIKIKPQKNICIVFLQNEPETPKRGDREIMEQPIPCVLFIGKRFKMVLKSGDYVLIKNQGRKLRLPYSLGPGQVRHINLSCLSRSDEFPVKIKHYERSSSSCLLRKRGTLTSIWCLIRG